MYSVAAIRGSKVAREGTRHFVGKVHHAIFHPTEPVVVGFSVRRMDIAGMKRRRDLFVALDSMMWSDGIVLASRDRDAWGSRACSRMGIDYDLCIIWEGMPALTETGESLGIVSDVEFDELTGDVVSISTSEGAVSRFLVGDSEHRTKTLIGFDGQAMVFRAAAAKDAPSGGAAAKAGAATARAVADAKEKLKPVTHETGEAFQRGAYRFGELLGRTKGMFKAFKEEYDRERHADDGR